MRYDNGNRRCPYAQYALVLSIVWLYNQSYTSNPFFRWVWCILHTFLAFVVASQHVYPGPRRYPPDVDTSLTV